MSWITTEVFKLMTSVWKFCQTLQQHDTDQTEAEMEM